MRVLDYRGLYIVLPFFVGQQRKNSLNTAGETRTGDFLPVTPTQAAGDAIVRTTRKPLINLTTDNAPPEGRRLNPILPHTVDITSQLIKLLIVGDLYIVSQLTALPKGVLYG